MQATGSWHGQFSYVSSKEFSKLKDLLGLLCFLGLEGTEPINLLLSSTF